MEIYKKYIEGKSYRELHEIRHQSVPGSDVYQQVVEEIHRIQQDTNNNQIADLIREIQNLKNIASENSTSSKRFAISSLGISIAAIVASVIIGGVQIYLAVIGVGPILEQQYKEESRQYESCREPGNWSPDDGGSTPGSTCKATYLRLKGKFGAYPPAEQVILNFLPKDIKGAISWPASQE